MREPLAQHEPLLEHRHARRQPGVRRQHDRVDGGKAGAQGAPDDA